MTKNILIPTKTASPRRGLVRHQERFEKGKEAVFAINLKERGELIGAMDLFSTSVRRSRSWVTGSENRIGVAVLHGSAHTVLHLAFTELHLNRVDATIQP